MHKIKLVNWAERRIKRRHKAPDLQISISPIGIKRWFSSALDVKCLDFNRYGMAIESRRALKEKERILINFKGKYISQSNISGLVTECTKVKHRYRISIVFTYAQDNKEYSRKTDNALSRIESLYNNQSSQTS